MSGLTPNQIKLVVKAKKKKPKAMVLISYEGRSIESHVTRACIVEAGVSKISKSNFPMKRNSISCTSIGLSVLMPHDNFQIEALIAHAYIYNIGPQKLSYLLSL
jgi:hypothetical protein